VPERVPLDDLVFQRTLYPRHDLSEGNLRRLAQVREAGREFDAIIACRTTRVIIDGAHRWTVARQRGDTDIATEWRDYATDAERFEAAARLNCVHGLALSSHDRLRVIEIGESLGLKEIQLADALAMSTVALRALRPRFATVREALDGGGELRRKVPLKASVRHLSGTEITPEQEQGIMGDAPGSSYLLLVRQLVHAIDLDLLPPRELHPALYEELAQLAVKIAAGTS
jgi:hypothetical protein